MMDFMFWYIAFIVVFGVVLSYLLHGIFKDI